MPKHDFRAALSTIPFRVPYESHGRDPQLGLDCVGLVLAVYKTAGMSIDKIDVSYGLRRGRLCDRRLQLHAMSHA